MVSGPSGVGKGTVVRRLLERLDHLRVSVSVTTRRPRPGERDGVDYSFVTEEGFDELIAADDLLEWAEVFGSRYGTPRRTVDEALDAGDDVILEIDVQGASRVHERAPEARLIFLRPPSQEELERRLRGRGTEDEGLLARRLEAAAWETEQAAWFDHVVVNDSLDEAATQVAAIIQASRPPTEGRARP